MRYVRDVDSSRDGQVAADRRRHAGRWLVLAIVLVLVPLLMVLVGWVMTG
jgi:hypothetical protein